VQERCLRRPWSLANFLAVFGKLTGEDARPTLWRGRPRPRLSVASNCIWEGFECLL